MFELWQMTEVLKVLKHYVTNASLREITACSLILGFLIPMGKYPLRYLYYLLSLYTSFSASLMDQDWKQCVQYSAQRLLEYKLEMRLYRQAEARSQGVLKLSCKRGAGFYFNF